MVLVNDWSARDIQKWEYQPLGPFLAKNFRNLDLAVGRHTRMCRRRFAPRRRSETGTGAVAILGVCGGDWSYDIQHGSAAAKREDADAVPRIKREQQQAPILEPVSANCASHRQRLQSRNPGDLLASGTISGPTPDSLGSMLELAWKGTRPLTLPGNGETRRVFLQDGDPRDNARLVPRLGYRIGFGEAIGRRARGLTSNFSVTTETCGSRQTKKWSDLEQNLRKDTSYRPWS